MVLTGKRILQEIEAGRIKIDPFDPAQLGPNSYNLRLHNELLTYRAPILDMKTDMATERIHIPLEGLLLLPEQFYLGRTLEYTETHGMLPHIDGRSSAGRLGLAVHITAGRGDVGFQGHWTCEIFVKRPLRIYPFVQICQLYFHDVSGEITPYAGKYQRNSDIQASRLWKELQDPVEWGKIEALNNHFPPTHRQ